MTTTISPNVLSKRRASPDAANEFNKQTVYDSHVDHEDDVT